MCTLSGFLAWLAWGRCSSRVPGALESADQRLRAVGVHVTRQRAHHQSFSRAVVRNLRTRSRPSIEPMVCIWPDLCSLENARGETRLTLRIYRSSTPDAIVFALSGDIDREHAAGLRDFLASETDRRVTLDLQNITLVDRPALQLLAGLEAAGIRLVNCPGYVRTWIAAERDTRPQRTQEPDTEGPQRGSDHSGMRRTL
jgi:ABC-type transporter Mla MlaB component